MEQKLIRTCSIWRALEVVGDVPTLLLLEVSWLGGRQFDEFCKRTRLLKALVSDRLKRLVAAGLMEKQLYCESPPRYNYVMTEKGRDLYWAALMLLRWERRWNDTGKIEVTLKHSSCGQKFDPTPACGECGEEFDATQVDWREGPGLGWMKPTYRRRRNSREPVERATSLMDQAAQLMGDRWASLIMRSIFTSVHRFDEIQADTAIASNILTERLNWLIGIGVIRQRQYGSSPPRYEYKLRRKGVDYYPALLMLMQWGDRYYVAPEGPPLVLTHKDCGEELAATVICSECREPIAPQDVTFRVTGEHREEFERQLRTGTK